jgi:hypothetical protein
LSQKKKEARFDVFRATIFHVYDKLSIDRFFKKCAKSIEKRAHFLDESPEKKIRNFRTPLFGRFPLACAQWWMDPLIVSKKLLRQKKIFVKPLAEPFSVFEFQQACVLSKAKVEKKEEKQSRFWKHKDGLHVQFSSSIDRCIGWVGHHVSLWMRGLVHVLCEHC